MERKSDRLLGPTARVGGASGNSARKDARMNSRHRNACHHALVLILLLACVAVRGAEINAVKLGKAEPLPGRLYGFNSDMVAATAFQGITSVGVEMENAVRELRPQALRFPGGSTANNYLWRKDSFSEATGDLTGWAGEHIGSSARSGAPMICRVTRGYAGNSS